MYCIQFLNRGIKEKTWWQAGRVFFKNREKAEKIYENCVKDFEGQCRDEEETAIVFHDQNEVLRYTGNIIQESEVKTYIGTIVKPIKISDKTRRY